MAQATDKMLILSVPNEMCVYVQFLFVWENIALMLISYGSKAGW